MIKWKYKPSGMCPVQAEGWFMDYYFYFRARWDEASIEFSKTEPGWENDLIHARYILWTTYNKPYKAGYLNKWFCIFLIYIGCIMFLLHKNKNKTLS